MSEPRPGRLIPQDGRTHIARINDWLGSDSRLEGARRDPEDTTMPDPQEAPLPYMLTATAFHDGAVRRAGEIVRIQPSRRGPHHQQLPDVPYPPDVPPAGTWDRTIPKFEALTIPLADHDARVAQIGAQMAELQKQLVASRNDVAARDATITQLRQKLNEATAAMSALQQRPAAKASE